MEFNLKFDFIDKQLKHTLGLKIFGMDGLFMKLDAYNPEGGNEGHYNI